MLQKLKNQNLDSNCRAYEAKSSFRNIFFQYHSRIVRRSAKGDSVTEQNMAGAVSEASRKSGSLFKVESPRVRDALLRKSPHKSCSPEESWHAFHSKQFLNR